MSLSPYVAGYAPGYAYNKFKNLWGGRVATNARINAMAREDYYARRGKKMQIPRGPATLARAGASRELGVIDTTYTNVPINTTHSIVLLNGCIQGTGIAERFGRRIRNVSVHIKGILHNDTNTKTNHCRLALVWDKQANGTAPTQAEIWSQTGTAGMRNPDNFRRFTVLWDELYTLSGNTLTSGQTNDTTLRKVDKFIKCPKSCITQFNAGNAGSVSDIETGSLHLVMYSQQVAGTSDSEFDGYVRLRFNPMP